jgi:hypothetical protein
MVLGGEVDCWDGERAGLPGWAWQTQLATSQDATRLNKRGLHVRWLTWRAISKP